MVFDIRAIVTPWSPPNRAYSSPRRIVVKLHLGEDPTNIASTFDVRARAQTSAAAFGLSGVDRALRRFSASPRVERVYAAAKNLRRPAARHVGWNEQEHLIGMSRTFRVDCGTSVPIDHVLDALRQDNRVEWATPYYYCAQSFSTLALDLPTQPENTVLVPSRSLIRASQSLAMESGDPAVIVAIVDTGVRLDHPAYRVRLRPGWDTVRLSQRDLSGVTLMGDSSRQDATPADDVGHGTSCAGILSAQSENLPRGIAGNCSILPIRVLGAAHAPAQSTALGIGAIPDIDAGMKIAVDLFARVINMSFGTPASAIAPGEPLPHTDVVRYALDHNCVLVAASGNSGIEERYTPACLDGVIAVGACNDVGNPCKFSTRGTHVQLSAPGENVPTTGLDDDHTATGTSFAAPFVTGAAALLVSHALARSTSVTAAQIASILRRSTTPWRTAQPGYGSGILNAKAALDLLDTEIAQAAALEDETG